LELGEREVRLAPDVPELEARLVVARVLVVDQPQLAADVDEVLGEQVVVARHRRLAQNTHRRRDRTHLGSELLVAVGKAEAALMDDREIATLDLEHVEVAKKRARAVQSSARRRDELEPVAAPE